MLRIAARCHKKDFQDNYNNDVKDIEKMYRDIKYLLKEEKDISLYRYRTINPYAKKEIEQKQIFMNVPSKFDDLFDSNFVVDIKSPDDDLAPRFHALYVSKYMEENLHGISSEGGTNGWDAYFKCINKDIDNIIRVSSLSEDYKNIPLWYYYANEHKGICIEYSLKEIVNNLRENEYIMPVVYTDNYFKYNPATAYTPEKTKMSVQANVLVKHDSWAFEKEWRIVQVCNGHFKEYTETIPIKSITFGLKVDEYDKRELKNLNKKTDFYELKRTCYGLKRVKVN